MTKKKPTNKEVYQNGDIITSYPCDINGSNQSIEYVIDFNGVEYIVHTDWNKKIINPNSKASKNNQ